MLYTRFYNLPKTVSSRNSLESNYLRYAELLLRFGPSAVRVIFDREFHPDFLQRELRKQTAELKRLKGRGLINPAQWAKLLTRKGMFTPGLQASLLWIFDPTKCLSNF